MPLSSRGLALLAIAGATIALTSCQSSSSSTSSAPAGASASASAAAPSSGPASGGSSGAAAGSSGDSGASLPSGYTRAGGSAQGISIGIPSSWLQADLAKESAAQAAEKLKVPGITASDLTQDISQLVKVHAIYAADIDYARTAKDHFARNINAYCTDSGVTESGSDGVPDLKSSIASQLGSVASNITSQDLTIGGVPGLETSYQLKSATVGTIYGSQLEVLPKAGKACYVTLTAITPQASSGILATAAQTAQFF